MAAPSSATLSGRKEGEVVVNNKKQELPHLLGEGASSVMASSQPGAADERRKRKHPGNPSKIPYIYISVCECNLCFVIYLCVFKGISK